MEGLILKFKSQYFGHLMWSADSFGKTLMLGKIEGRTRRGKQRMSWLDGITDSMDMNLGKLQKLMTDREALCAGSQRVRHKWVTELNWNNYLASLLSVGKWSPGSIPGLGRFTGERIGYLLLYSWASLVDQLVKNLPEMWETWVWSLSWMTSWRRDGLPSPVFWPGKFHELYSPWGCKELDTTEWLSLSF